MSNLVFKYLIVPFILILSAGFIFWYFDLGVWQDIQAVRDVIAKNKEVLVQRQKLAENLKNLMAQYQEKIQDVAKINQIMPNNPAIPDLLVMLEALAGGNSLVFEGVDFNLVRPVGGPAALELGATLPAGLQVVNISAKVKGSYPNFLNYLKAVETNLRLLDTESVSFNVAPAVGGAVEVSGLNNIKFIAVVNAYYQ
ncbi:hypothetical protein A2833_02295 [Candidatus Azambacteria bacterium RIFCSPHIGHO2_01_FULL_44_55]|uniref:Pilus assembly protein PilO n=1 Tax=Candidatus Azambacteria bacterium RIFCSPLOWO2_02_FULL_44_14 TaxID=1797306 RepID=A0A1F5CB52_9BACT|nr:MAG: hypothetical protein A3A18_00450 [Candidatus Azambacteria bacterium RIFCSPLOWO2_01_FULL_44_84]OGD33605.1 MAG: hypothetical protein A3C78_00505 [Candidatus Azambacteria bacterium RIFCSPHIGHO2_02_FULL_45_18]OGD40028.1 MAG: hypothetical protein A3I30_00245 [Candidatus Azambacteria bacterium RIFCSPLOWO2_02_FULL_44_14]OGD40909.1 MAG: hypothetical protein A2833_02295 [Candidatus Azambacteria bacterium RIFCSPHIGHO2_01_FULL_44_55]OGD51641.1 MAG: hypothetical protein A2608_01675 [Candidatus Azam